MKLRKFILVAILLLPVFSSIQGAKADRSKGTSREAVELYRDGMYERARAIFERLSPDPLADGYVVLCALKMRSDDKDELMNAYHQNYPSTILSGRIYFENARILFDEGKYAEASKEFYRVPESILADYEMAEYFFKCGYSYFCTALNIEAMMFFKRLEQLEYNEYTVPAYYFEAIIQYNSQNFSEAILNFEKALSDSRFSELSSFYIIDCEFNLKNYDFVIEWAEEFFQYAPQERKERLARILSETYLILGDTEKAKKYYEEVSLENNPNRKDLFYAGTVLYSVHDYRGAILYYTQMQEVSDSLGQIANYHLGNAYMHTGNKVAAMKAFQEASKVDFDGKITEDAFFNYAKLAFDLNKDTSGFNEYIKRYSTRTKGVQIYEYMALAALYDKDYATAIDVYDKIDELTPDMLSNYTKVNFLRGQQLYSTGAYSDAISHFRSTSYYLPRTDRLSQYARYWLGECYYNSGNYKEAASNFTELYNGSALYNMDEGRLLPYNIGYCYFKLNDYNNASKWFDIYINSGNKLNREDALNRRADCDFGLHNYEAAAASYGKVLNEYAGANNIYPYYQQALSYGLSGDTKRKMSTLMQVNGASPEAWLYSEALYELGRSQLDLNMNKEALESFSHLRANTKDSLYVIRALSGSGLAYRNLSRYNEALECYDRIVKTLPGTEYSEEALMAIESIYQSQRQPEKYVEYLENNSLQPTGGDADIERVYFNTVEQVYLAGNYNETLNSAFKYLDKFSSGGNTLQVCFYLAEAYRALGDKERACENYAKAMNSNSELSFVEMAKLRYAQLSYDLERYRDACDGYTALYQSTRIEDNKFVAAVGIMRSAYRCKDYETAINSSDLVRNISSDSNSLIQEALHIKARSLLALSRREEAMRVFEILAKEASTSYGAEASYVLIQNSFDNGNFDAVEQAVYNFAQAAGSQSYWLARAYLVLGDSFAQRGNYTQAKATYESVRDGYRAEAGQQDDIASSVNTRLERIETLMDR